MDIRHKINEMAHLEKDLQECREALAEAKRNGWNWVASRMEEEIEVICCLQGNIRDEQNHLQAQKDAQEWAERNGEYRNV